MRGRKKLVPLVIATGLTWLMVAWMTSSFSPQDTLLITNYKLPITNLFFFLFFITTSLSLMLLLNNTKRGLLLGLGATIFLVLRLLKLTHPFYLIILIGMIVALEFFFRKR